MRWGNIVLGAMGLAILQGLVSGKGAGNVGGFIANAGKAVEWFVDPTVPAFKNTSTPSTAPTAQASFTPPAQPAASGIPLSQQSAQTQAQGGVV